MFETVVIATDGSASAERAVAAAADLANAFDAAVHALYVVDEGEIGGTPEDVRADLAEALTAAGEEALEVVRDETAAAGVDQVTTAVREGDPAVEICSYAREVDADVVATGTRGRHGEHSFLLGSVAEAVVRNSPIPVLTVRQQ
ncbi:MAG: universal stress protein [Halobacteriales archaeon]|jgi:nucleotide-binding universal stress UspA family protein